MSKKPEEYYPKLNNLLNALKNNIKKNVTKEPLDKIKNSKNPERYLLKLFKNINNQNDRLLNGKLRNLLGRWRKNAIDDKASNLKTKILYNLKIYLDDSQKKKLLSKYLTKWQLKSAKKPIDTNFYKAVNKLIYLLRRHFKPDIYDAVNKKAKDLDKKTKLNNLVKILQNNQNNNLHKIFINLWKKAINTDPNKETKIKTKLKKIIKNNELDPKSRAFKKWFKLIHIFELKDKDKLHAIKILVNLLRNHDKMEIIRALNLWKERLYKIREQYLKALLIKISTRCKRKNDQRKSIKNRFIKMAF